MQSVEGLYNLPTKHWEARMKCGINGLSCSGTAACHGTVVGFVAPQTLGGGFAVPELGRLALLPALHGGSVPMRLSSRTTRSR